jgi:small subunit ribosomal protein S7
MSGREQVNIKLFNKWDTNNIEVTDIGLNRVISLRPSAVIPITFGRHEHQG